MGYRDLVSKIKLILKMTKCECVEVVFENSKNKKCIVYFHKDQNISRKMKNINELFKGEYKILKIEGKNLQDEN